MILVVDDDNAVRESMALMMKVAGLDSCCVSTANDAVNAVRGGDISLAILDMNLRHETDGRDGIELLRKLLVLQPDLPVILISAWGTIPLVVEGMKYGAVDFVSKPWSNRHLLMKIKNALSKARELAEKPRPTLDQLEREAILSALRNADGNLSKAADELGLSRQSLYRRIEKYGL